MSLEPAPNCCAQAGSRLCLVSAGCTRRPVRLWCFTWNNGRARLTSAHGKAFDWVRRHAGAIQCQAESAEGYASTWAWRTLGCTAHVVRVPVWEGKAVADPYGTGDSSPSDQWFGFIGAVAFIFLLFYTQYFQ